MWLNGGKDRGMIQGQTEGRIEGRIEGGKLGKVQAIRRYNNSWQVKKI